MTRSGPSDSAKDVKPRRSLNMTVASRCDAAEPGAVRLVQHLADHGFGHEPPEQVAHALALEAVVT